MASKNLFGLPVKPVGQQTASMFGTPRQSLVRVAAPRPISSTSEENYIPEGGGGGGAASAVVNIYGGEAAAPAGGDLLPAVSTVSDGDGPAVEVSMEPGDIGLSNFPRRVYQSNQGFARPPINPFHANEKTNAGKSRKRKGRAGKKRRGR